MSLGISKASQTSKNKDPKEKRVSKSELKNRVQILLNKETCQVCEWSTELDYPHHALFGIAKKDDRNMICICVQCHRHIHTKGFPIHGKSRADTVEIGKLNNEEFLNA